MYLGVISLHMARMVAAGRNRGHATEATPSGNLCTKSRRRAKSAAEKLVKAMLCFEAERFTSRFNEQVTTRAIFLRWHRPRAGCCWPHPLDEFFMGIKTRHEDTDDIDGSLNADQDGV
jgi:hypothetical protein